MTITISMPTYNTPAELLERAVRSVLGQTYKDIILVVVNDGGETVSLDVSDDRLIVFDLDRNYGRYFADTVALGACSTELFSTHDSDDFSDPCRLEVLLDKKGENPMVAGAVVRRDKGEHIPNIPPNIRGLHHLWFMSALYDTEHLEGMIHPGFRVGYDTLLSTLFALDGRVSLSHEPLYHVVRRENSLTTSIDTGLNSRFRAEERRKLINILRCVYKFKNHPDFLALTKSYIQSIIPTDLKISVERNVASLVRLV